MFLPQQDEWKLDMGVGNGTVVTEFIIAGFSGLDQRLQLFLHLVLLLMYLTTVTGNAAIIFLVCVDNRLTKMLVILSSDRRTISVGGCFAQSSFYFALGVAEFALLVVMSFDRYVAICQPLRYAAIMKHRLCIHLVAAVWVMGFAFLSYHLVLLSKLTFCGLNKIEHFFCDNTPLFQLSCSDTSLLWKTESVFIFAILAFGCFVFIVLSYVQIFRAVLRIPSQQGRHKAFSTCLPHLAVVSLFISTGTFSYLKPPSTSSSSLNLLLAVLYSVVPPTLNPLIYSMRNQELKDSLGKLVTGRISE
uniref:Olfactory receptor n=1 Tax=Anser cygnoides TaxID=8845 RepID=A0A8B9DRY5_ANSCY